MYDARKGPAFEPVVDYAVMTDWALGNGPSQPTERFLIDPAMLRRLPKTLGVHAGANKGARIATRTTAKHASGAKKAERRLSCLLPAGIETVPLYSLDSREALEQLAVRARGMWTS